ncbi:hypothetical protein RBA66_25870, partial [Citrobacter freundii]
MENIALIGIDLGKNSFHIHCQDHRGKAVYRKKGTVAKLAMRQPFVLFKGLTFQKLCL